MLKRCTVILLVLLLLCSCARLAEGEYRVVTEHTETSADPETTGQVFEVHTYSGLKRTVQELVNANAEDGLIRAVEYNGNIRDDISKACLEVTRSSPLGAYAVDYMTHAVTRILTYDEISIHINYKLSPDEISAVRTASSLSDFYLHIDEGLEAGEEFLALQIVTLGVNERVIKNYVSSYYRQHPDALLSMPDISVSFYPSEEYVQKIITLSLDYHTPSEEREPMLERLRSKARTLTRGTRPSRPDEAALLCCEAVAAQLDHVSSRGRTAYDVLVNGTGSSEGCAMAFQLLCGMCGVPCQVISGRLNSETHYWNLILLDREYYHVDCSACVRGDLTDGFLKRDSDIWGSYWWEPDSYPAAEGSLTAEAVLKKYRAAEPKPGSPFSVVYVE